MKLVNLINNKKITSEIIANATYEEINYINDKKEVNSSPLFLAISIAKIDIIKDLIKNKKANLNLIAANDISLLNYAILKNNFAAVKLLINDSRFELLNFKNNYPLFTAFKMRNEKIIILLLKHQNIDVNIVDSSDANLLFITVLSKLPFDIYQIIKLIVENPNFNLINHKINIKNFFMPFTFWLVWSGDLKLIDLVLNHPKLEINSELFTERSDEGEPKKSLLHLAVKKNILKTIKKIISKNVDINVQDSMGATPLHYSVFLNSDEVTKLLIENQTKLDIQNNNGDTALHLAVMAQCKNIVKLLVTNCANLNIQNTNGNTPLHLAILIKKNSSIILHYLLQGNYDFTLKNKQNMTVLQLAIISGNFNLSILIANYMVYATETSNNVYIDEKILNQKIRELIEKNFLKFKFKKFLNDINFSEISASLENDSLLEHLNFLEKFRTNFETNLNNLGILSKLWNYSKKETLLKELNLYMESVKIEINDFMKNFDICNQIKNINEFKVKLKEIKSSNVAVNKTDHDNKIKIVEEEENKEKRFFIKKENKIPKGQQPKKRCATLTAQKQQKHELPNKKLHQNKIIVSPIKQHNLIAIEEWEKKSLKESIKLSKLGKNFKKINSDSLLNDFPFLQESFCNLNQYELNKTMLWWKDFIIKIDENDLDSLLQQIIEKIHAVDYKERIITEEEFKILENFRKDKFNKEKIKNENLFSIIILHRNNIQDHKNGRPAISLGKSNVTNKELVIPGTTKKIKYYQYFHLKLNDNDTYFYLKNIVSINENDNLGLWNSNKRSMNLSSEEINQLLEMIDSYNLSKLDSNNFLINAKYINIDAGTSKMN